MDRISIGRRCAQAGAAIALGAVATLTYAQTTVTMWTFLDPNKTSPREVALKQIVADFEKANPAIRIKVEPQDFAAMPPKFFLGHRAGGNPDVVWIDAKNLGGLLQSGSAADLGPLFLNKWSAAQRDDYFVRAAWNAGAQGDKVYALPVFHGASVIYYRKDLLREAGINPDSLKSWDQLLAAAKKLTREKDGRVEVWGFGMPLAPLKTESTPLTIGMVDSPKPMFTACKADFATEAGARGLKMVAAMITADRITPKEALTLNVDDITDQFSAGRYAIAISSSLRYSGIVKAATFDKTQIGILPWPTWSGQKAGPMPVSGWWIAIWNKSQHIPEAAKFVEYVGSPAAVKLWASVGGQVPTRKSLLSDPMFAQPEYAWVGTMVNAWSGSSWMEPTECNTRTLQTVLNEAVHRVVLDKTDPTVALKEAEAKFADAQK